MKTLVSKLSCRGWVELYKNGKLVRRIPNRVVNTGLALTSLLLTGSGTAPGYIAIGKGTTAPTATDTALENEYARGVATRTRGTTSVENDTAIYEREFAFTESAAITESGLFNASTSGTMFNRATFSAVSLQNGDHLLVRWKVKVSWASS